MSQAGEIFTEVGLVSHHASCMQYTPQASPLTERRIECGQRNIEGFRRASDLLLARGCSAKRSWLVPGCACCSDWLRMMMTKGYALYGCPHKQTNKEKPFPEARLFLIGAPPSAHTPPSPPAPPPLPSPPLADQHPDYFAPRPSSPALPPILQPTPLAMVDFGVLRTLPCVLLLTEWFTLLISFVAMATQVGPTA